MIRTLSLVLTILILCAVGYAVYSLRTGARHGQETQLAELKQRNAALADETARLEAFLDSPLCRDTATPTP